MKLKYVIVPDRLDIELPILFSNLLEHKQFEHLKPVAAGFVTMSKNLKDEISHDGCCIRDIDFFCYGSTNNL